MERKYEFYQSMQTFRVWNAEISPYSIRFLVKNTLTTQFSIDISNVMIQNVKLWPHQIKNGKQWRNTKDCGNCRNVFGLYLFPSPSDNGDRCDKHVRNCCFLFSVVAIAIVPSILLFHLVVRFQVCAMFGYYFACLPFFVIRFF